MWAFKKGSTSVILPWFIQDNSVTTGAGLTGLTSGSSGLVASYSRPDQGNAGSTTFALSGGTRGTWSSGGFVEKDSTNEAGMYEVGVPDAVFAAGANWAVVYLKGATNMAATPHFIRLTGNDFDDSVRLGITALPNAAAGASGGLIVNGTNAGTVNLAALTVTGACSFGSTFGVAGAFSLQSTATVTGACSFGSTLSVAGAVALQSTLGITGAVTLSSTLGVGATTLSALTVTNATTLTGAVSLGSTLTITGACSLGSTLSVAGAVALQSTLGVTGATTFTGAVTMSNGLAANITGNLVGTVSTLTTYTGNTPQTGDSYAIVNNGTYGLSALKTLIDTLQTSATSIIAKVGAFSGTGVNSVFGFFRALLRSDVSAPSDVGGTFDPASHSTQAIRARGDAAWLTATGFSTLTTGDIPTTAQIADKILGRNLAGGSDGGRTVKDALRLSRNKWVRTATTLTVYAEDDSTEAWSSTLVAGASLDPVASSDPA